MNSKRTHKPNSVYAVIPLGEALPLALISDLPGGFGNCSSRLTASGRYGARRGSFSALSSLFGLAPCGVYPACRVTVTAVRSYRTFSPLPDRAGRYVLCGTGRPRALTPASRTLSGTLPCGVRTFLPRMPRLRQAFGSDRPVLLPVVSLPENRDQKRG